MSAAKDADVEHASKMDTVSETSSQKNQKHIEAFEIEKLSQKIILLRPTNEAHEGSLMVQHGEAVYMVRKNILERAKNFWKETKEIPTNYVLGMTERKQKQLDSLFEKKCIDQLGYQLGEQYED